MARSRRRYPRRTTSQRAAGLIAMALPAPVQRIADSRIGSLLMLVGVPAMIVFGLLNVTWQDGFPTFTFNRDRAAALRKVANDQLNSLEYQAATDDWGQSVVDFLHAAQGPNHVHAAPFPSTSPQPPSTATNWQQPQQYPPSQSSQYQQPTYQQTGYQQPAYQQPAYQQPAYQQPTYQQPTYQQPTYQQPTYQQPTYQQPGYQQQSSPNYSTQAAQPRQNYGPYQQPSQPWAGNVGYQNNQGFVATPPGYAAPSSGYPAGYAPQQPYNGYSIPSSSTVGQGSYPNSSGQLLRY